MSYEPTSWKKTPTFEFTTPSGQTCLMKTLDIQKFLLSGDSENIDTFTQFIDKTYVKPKGAKPEDHKGKKSKASKEEDGEFFMELVKTGDFNKLMKIIDVAVVEVVVEPKVNPLPADDEERDDDLVYVDDIDLMDKMSIFTRAVGKISDLTGSDFREES